MSDPGYDNDQVDREMKRVLRRFSSQQMTYLAAEEMLWRTLIQVMLGAYSGDMRAVVDNFAKTVYLLDRREREGEFATPAGRRRKAGVVLH